MQARGRGGALGHDERFAWAGRLLRDRFANGFQALEQLLAGTPAIGAHHETRRSRSGARCSRGHWSVWRQRWPRRRNGRHGDDHRRHDRVGLGRIHGRDGHDHFFERRGRDHRTGDEHGRDHRWHGHVDRWKHRRRRRRRHALRSHGEPGHGLCARRALLPSPPPFGRRHRGPLRSPHRSERLPAERRLRHRLLLRARRFRSRPRLRAGLPAELRLHGTGRKLRFRGHRT
jgi:hypothetical protein